ncbi:hypothetical protein K5X82_11540 [Halosquirtibacter xylanolyticus]|uniref:hypothetical protein n=1 Tax=Halosquirtibacter xylanolyticus TaxID=3374599 RepID=UPI003747EB34|nr:hypothetical protein K5X82_11540 [Prolixibacteraceae bacterium]
MLPIEEKKYDFLQFRFTGNSKKSYPYAYIHSIKQHVDESYTDIIEFEYAKINFKLKGQCLNSLDEKIQNRKLNVIHLTTEEEATYHPHKPLVWEVEV